MANVKPYVKEITITIIAFVWLLFVATNVNVQLGQTYLHFTLGSLALLIIGLTIFDKKLHITFQRQPGGHLKAIMIGFAGWIALLIASIVVLKFVDPSKANVSAVIGLLGAATPALATSKIANWLTFGGVVPFVETQLWARLMEFFADLFHIDMSKRFIRILFSALVVLIVILALAFVFFHLTAKGITNAPALVIVFLMMVISLIMVIIFQETRQAVYLHIWANSIAAYIMLFSTAFIQI